MIHIKLSVELDHVDQVVAMLKDSELIASIEVEDIDDQNLKPMTATDFYKKINAANLAQKEKRLFSQSEMEKEVQSW
ncbi:MAG: hypothetical protein NW226_18005 [Microscillaceae bacterium]|nr:hypothetical protein [Microscillaceae bacterium]